MNRLELFVTVIAVALAGIVQDAPSTMVAAAAPGDGVGGGEADVSTAAELLSALEDRSIKTIRVNAPMALPPAWGPVLVDRAVEVTSPGRSLIDFCADGCGSGAPRKRPHIVVADGGALTLSVLYAKNTVPPLPASGGVGAVARAYPRLDFKRGPMPTIVAEGGGRTVHSLMSYHFLPAELYVHRMAPSDGWWARAAKEGKLLTPSNEPATRPSVTEPNVYGLPSFAPFPEAKVADAFVPFDPRGCLLDRPITTTVAYCSYTLKVMDDEPCPTAQKTSGAPLLACVCACCFLLLRAA